MHKFTPSGKANIDTKYKLEASEKIIPHETNFKFINQTPGRFPLRFEAEARVQHVLKGRL